MRRTIVVVATALSALLLLASIPSVTEQGDLESRVSKLESEVNDLAGAGLVFFLFGSFCALWAQNTARNPWLWFVTGAIFTVITVFVLPWKKA